MARVLFVHFQEDGAHELARRLRVAGHEVLEEGGEGHAAWSRIRSERWDVLAISCRSHPSKGHVAAGAVKTNRLSRLPLVFVEPPHNAIEQLKDEHPQAVFCTWDGLPDVVQALTSPDIPQPSPESLRS